MKELSEKVGVELLKGASVEVDKQAALLVKTHGKDILNDIAKLNFKNTEKLKEYI